MDLVKEILHTNALMLYAQTGDERYLKEANKMGFNEPVHLPQPKAGPYADPVEFDELDDKFMEDLTDKYLGKPLCALMGTLHTMGDVSDNPMLCAIKNELIELRNGLKEKFREDY